MKKKTITSLTDKKCGPNCHVIYPYINCLCGCQGKMRKNNKVPKWVKDVQKNVSPHFECHISNDHLSAAFLSFDKKPIPHIFVGAEGFPVLRFNKLNSGNFTILQVVNMRDRIAKWWFEFVRDNSVDQFDFTQLQFENFFKYVAVQIKRKKDRHL